MRNFLIAITTCLAAFGAAQADAQNVSAADVKVLIIGVSEYPNLNDRNLPTTLHDADGLNNALVKGFSASNSDPAKRVRVPQSHIRVIKGNVSRKKIVRAWTKHLDQLSAKDEVSIFFFSGHGLESDGKPFLIASDFETGDPPAASGVSLRTIVHQFQKRFPNKLGVFIVDACRSDPNAPPGKFTDAEGSFAPVVAPTGTIVLYSASPGKIALAALGPGDQDKRSVYTRVLIALLEKFGTTKGLAELGKDLKALVSDLALRRRGDNNALLPFIQTPTYYDEIKGRRNILGARLKQPSLQELGLFARNEMLIATADRVAGTSTIKSVSDTTGSATRGASRAANAPATTDPDATAAAESSESSVPYRRAIGSARYRSSARGARSASRSQTSSRAPASSTPTTEKPAELTGASSDLNLIFDCPACPEFVALPEKNGHRVAMGKYEVTRGDWYRFERLDSNRQSMPKLLSDDVSPDDRKPMTGVTWQGANAYAKWLSKQVSDVIRRNVRYRLPTEEEWMRAARGKADHQWPSGGDDSVAALCNYANGADRSLRTLLWANTTCDDGKARETSSVGSYKSNSLGLHDMAGNVWEWVDDCGEDAANGNDCKRRIAKGGSWRSGPDALKAGARQIYLAEHGRSRVGFRLLQELY